jgi:CRP-like cAMP-binding protein
MYYIASGTVALREPGVTLERGAILGEISLFSAGNRRTATAACATDCELYSVTQEVVLQLFYQRPELGFFLIRLVTARLHGDGPATASLPPPDAG